MEFHLSPEPVLLRPRPSPQYSGSFPKPELILTRELGKALPAGTPAVTAHKQKQAWSCTCGAPTRLGDLQSCKERRSVAALQDVPRRERILPTCDGSCCRGDAPGRFYRPATDPSRRIWWV